MSRGYPLPSFSRMTNAVMAESAASAKPCFLCDKNPRETGEVICKSCREEHPFCYECGEKKRNHPFKLCSECYQASRRSTSHSAATKQKASSGGRSPKALGPSRAKAPQVPAASPSTRRDSGGTRHQGAGTGDDSTCILPGCSKPKYTDKLSGYIHDFCGKTHADEYTTSRVAPPTLLKLGNGQNTYKDLVKRFKKEWVKTSEAYPTPPDPTAIYAVQNPSLVEQFQKYGTEIRQAGSASNSDHFFHGTSIKCDLLTTNVCCSDPDCGVCGISRQGFDESRIGSNISRFKRFGHGIYLAPNSSKCHDYTQGVAEYGVRAQLLCLVACGAKHELLWDNTKLVAPPQSFHSVHGKAGGSLNYDEIVVYDVKAILPQYIFLYEHDGVDKIAR